MAPAPDEFFAVFGLGGDDDACTRRAPPVESGQQLVGEGLAHEGSLVDALDRWIERGGDLHLGGRVGERRGPEVEPRCQPVGVGAVDAETAGDVGGVERGVGAEGVDAETQADVDEVGTIEQTDGAGREERRRLAGRDDGDPGVAASVARRCRGRGSGGDGGGEHAVGDTDTNTRGNGSDDVTAVAGPWVRRRRSSETAPGWGT